MGVLFEVVEIIQKRIKEENHRPWLEVIEEVKAELKTNRVLNKNKVE